MLNAVQEAIAMGRKCGSIPVKINEFEVKGYRVHRGRYTLASLACLGLGITFGLLLVLLVRRNRERISKCGFFTRNAHWDTLQKSKSRYSNKKITSRKKKLKDSFGIFYEYMRKDMGTSCSLKLVVL